MQRNVCLSSNKTFVFYLQVDSNCDSKCNSTGNLVVKLKFTSLHNLQCSIPVEDNELF